MAVRPRSDEAWNGRIEELTLRPNPVARPELGGDLDSRQIDEGLQRLVDHRLIDGSRVETIGYAHWTRLRLRGKGLIVLGEWPDLDRVAGAAGMQTLLAALAERAESPDDKSVLRQTAATVGRIGEGIVEQTLGSIGADLASGL